MWGFFSHVILISLNVHAVVQYKTTVFKAVVWQHLRKDNILTFGLFSPQVYVAALENVASSVQTTIGKYMKANSYSEKTCRP